MPTSRIAPFGMQVEKYGLTFNNEIDMKKNVNIIRLVLVMALCVTVTACKNKKENSEEQSSEQSEVQNDVVIPSGSFHDDEDDLAFAKFEEVVKQDIIDKGQTLLDFKRDYDGWGKNRGKIYLTIKYANGDVVKADALIEYFSSTKTWEIVDSFY